MSSAELAVLGLAVVGLIAAAVIVSLFEIVTVFEYQRGLRYRKGRFVGVLGPGRYRVWKPRTYVRLVDVRQRALTIPGQEVLTSEGAPLKVSLAASYVVSDPARAINDVENYDEAFYLALQVALRQTVGGMTLEELLAKRPQLGASLQELAAPAVAALGLQLLSLDLKDIMFTGEMRKLFTQVLRAQKEGQAALEQARGETAALRSLLNIARTLEDHPSLLQLRALQRLGESSGNTVVLGMPPGGVVPVRGKGGGSPQQDEREAE